MLICYFTQDLSKVTRVNQWGSEGGAYTAEAAKLFWLIIQACTFSGYESKYLCTITLGCKRITVIYVSS